MNDGPTVAERLYLLVHGQVKEFVLTAALVGAVLGELRLHGRWTSTRTSA
ncbi:hypothetical protein ACTMTJ_21335 [Phytohabitans sp. LJ34]